VALREGRYVESVLVPPVGVGKRAVRLATETAGAPDGDSGPDPMKKRLRSMPRETGASAKEVGSRPQVNWMSSMS